MGFWCLQVLGQAGPVMWHRGPEHSLGVSLSGRPIHLPALPGQDNQDRQHLCEGSWPTGLNTPVSPVIPVLWKNCLLLRGHGQNPERSNFPQDASLGWEGPFLGLP